jgi:hypothetical protein
MAILKASTKALASNDPGDATYTSIEENIQLLTAQRDALAAEIKGLLNGAEFKRQPFNTLKALSLIVRGDIVLQQANHLPH